MFVSKLPDVSALGLDRRGSGIAVHTLRVGKGRSPGAKGGLFVVTCAWLFILMGMAGQPLSGFGSLT